VQSILACRELGVAVQKVLGADDMAGHVLSDDPLGLAVLSFQLQRSLLAAHRKYNQSLRLAQATAKSRFRWVTARPIADIAIAIGTLAGLLDSCGFKDAASSISSPPLGS
jgi:hypothetical protein